MKREDTGAAPTRRAAPLDAVPGGEDRHERGLIAARAALQPGVMSRSGLAGKIPTNVRFLFFFVLDSNVYA